MNHSTIEFSPVPEDATQQVRSCFRVHVAEKDAVSFEISSFSYRVSDISETGIGILLKNDQVFQIGDHLDSCRVHFGDIHLTGLNGAITHCSPHEDFWQFGIQWINMSDSHKHQIAHLLSKLKNHQRTSTPTPESEHPREEP